MEKTITIDNSRKHHELSFIEDILNMKPEDITKQKLYDLFVTKANTPARFKPTDTFVLPAGKLYNETAITTTLGRYIYNLFALTPNIIKEVGYYNEVMGKSGIGKLEGKMSQLLLNDKITVEDFMDYIDKTQWLGFSISNVMSPGYGYDIVMPLQEVTERKKELELKYAKELAENDPKAASEMEKELLELAEKILVDNEVMGMDIYTSGVSKGFGNNYKNTSVMRGPMSNNSEPGTFRVSTSNLIEGIPKDEFYKYADVPVTASSGRALETQKGGLTYKFTLNSFNCWEDCKVA